MKLRIASLSLLGLCLTLAVVPAAAQGIYNDGPINGTSDGWTINFGWIVGDTFTVSGGTSTITGMSFGAWLEPGDTLTSAEVSMTSYFDGGITYFDQTVNFTASGCATNQYGFNVCDESGIFSGPTLNNGTYWVNLQNASTTENQPVYWDENSGVGCTSPGCPSQALEQDGTLPGEAFTIQGTDSSTGTVPEPSGLVLFTSGFVGVAAMLRRKLF
jgi:hypothetical protein